MSVNALALEAILRHRTVAPVPPTHTGLLAHRSHKNVHKMPNRADHKLTRQGVTYMCGYLSRRQESNIPIWNYTMGFTGSPTQFNDFHGILRWTGDQNEIEGEGTMLMTDQIMTVLHGLQAVYAPLTTAGSPPVFVTTPGLTTGEDAEATLYHQNPPNTGVIVRIMHHQSIIHFNLIVVFVEAERTVFFDSLNNKLTNEGLDELEAWSAGSVVPYQRDTYKPNVNIRILQDDGWSCGLWCLTFIQTLFDALLDQLSLSASSGINYDGVIDLLQQRWKLKNHPKMMDMDTAKAYARIGLQFPMINNQPGRIEWDTMW